VQHDSPDEETSVVRLPRDGDDRATIDTAERIRHAIAQARRGGSANIGHTKPSGADPCAASGRRTGAAPVASRCHAARDTAGGWFTGTAPANAAVSGPRACCSPA
jgi:hypothetical protein